MGAAMKGKERQRARPQAGYGRCARRACLVADGGDDGGPRLASLLAAALLAARLAALAPAFELQGAAAQQAALPMLGGAMDLAARRTCSSVRSDRWPVANVQTITTNNSNIMQQACALTSCSAASGSSTASGGDCCCCSARTVSRAALCSKSPELCGGLERCEEQRDRALAAERRLPTHLLAPPLQCAVAGCCAACWMTSQGAGSA